MFGSPIQIRISDEEMRISNSCILPSGWTLETLLGPHTSEPYNPNIARVFYLAGYIETWGRGVEKIFETCEELGAPKPEYSILGNGVTVRFPALQSAISNAPNVQNEHLEYTLENRILTAFRSNPKITYDELEILLGVSRSSLHRTIQQLTDEGKVMRTGDKMEQILIIEDDTSLNHGLCRALKADNRQVISCLNIKTAREQLLCGSVSLVLLDINLPDGSGLDFLKELKAAAPMRPVILLTANDTDIDIVTGLEQGADDYITKPFSLSVLRARVNTQLRKNVASVSANTFQIDRFVFDFDRMQFAANGAAVELSKTEQKLLRLLVENQGSAMSRSNLIDRIWTDGAEYVDENALSVTIKRLRDKLGAQDYIQTVYGIGYTWGKKHG